MRDAVMRGKVKLAFVAPDASQNSRAKVIPLLTARKIRFVESLTSAELGGVGGREQTAAVGIVDGQLAKGMREVLESASAGAQ